MRKRMSRMKKEMAVAVAAAMCISLVGCGGGSSKKVVADKKEAWWHKRSKLFLKAN